jgi:hypothetical protein
MADELKKNFEWRERGLNEVLFRHLSGRTKEDHDNLSQNGRCPDLDLNAALLEYKSRALPLHQSGRCLFSLDMNLCVTGQKRKLNCKRFIWITY